MHDFDHPGAYSSLRILIVAPVEQGSGETITALHVAERLAACGAAVGFLASEFASRFVADRFSERLWQLGPCGEENHRLWAQALREMTPDVVLFADYALMFFPSGCAPLAREPGWVDQLSELDIVLVTLDHFGFSQIERGFFLGPSHLSLFAYYDLPSPPPNMRVMLPCPMHEPGPVPHRIGQPFRYWEIPLSVPDHCRNQVRREFGVKPGGILVMHFVPAWTIAATEQLGLPLYRFLPQLLDCYLGDSSASVTLVSVNNGHLLRSADCAISITNLPSIPHHRFEQLLFSADLVITENALSISMGKAVCGLQPCAVLTNSFRLPELVARTNGRVREVVLDMERARLGAVYPFVAYPMVTPEDLENIGLYRSNSLVRAFRNLELFGGPATRDEIQALLRDPAERNRLRCQQQEYVDAVNQLPDGARLLADLAGVISEN